VCRQCLCWIKQPLLLMPVFCCSLHAAGQRWVPIIDCGIPVVEDDAAYQQGIAADVFIKDGTGKPFTGQVVRELGAGGRYACAFCHLFVQCAISGVYIGTRCFRRRRCHAQCMHAARCSYRIAAVCNKLLLLLPLCAAVAWRHALPRLPVQRPHLAVVAAAAGPHVQPGQV
jgi:hypothetical protein